jgi:hypothetical protein
VEAGTGGPFLFDLSAAHRAPTRFTNRVALGGRSSGGPKRSGMRAQAVVYTISFPRAQTTPVRSTLP